MLTRIRRYMAGLKFMISTRMVNHSGELAGEDEEEALLAFKAFSFLTFRSLFKLSTYAIAAFSACGLDMAFSASVKYLQI